MLDSANVAASVSPTQNIAPISSELAGLYAYNASATFGSLVIIDRLP